MCCRCPLWGADVFIVYDFYAEKTTLGWVWSMAEDATLMSGRGS
jgi:hypothetical protein